MKKSIVLFVTSSFCLACLFLVSCQPTSTCTLSAEDESFIQTEIADSQTNWNGGDREGYANRYAEDAVFMIPNGDALQGKGEIKAWLNSIPEVKIEFDVVEIIGSCDLAAVRGTYKLASPDGAVSDNGKWLQIWQKAEDDQWHLTRDIFNSDLPLPTSDNAAEPGAEG